MIGYFAATTFFPAVASAKPLVTTKSHDKVVSSIPFSAMVMGIKVGVDTVGEVERRFGNGLIVTGAQPQGARIWRIPGGSGFVFVDGFDYKRAPGNSLIISKVLISTNNPHPDEWTHIPFARLSRREAFYLNRIRLGMQYLQVKHALNKVRGLDVEGGEMWFQRKGNAVIAHDRRYSAWESYFEFNNRRLAQISIAAG